MNSILRILASMSLLFSGTILGTYWALEIARGTLDFSIGFTILCVFVVAMSFSITEVLSKDWL